MPIVSVIEYRLGYYLQIINCRSVDRRLLLTVNLSKSVYNNHSHFIHLISGQFKFKVEPLFNLKVASLCLADQLLQYIRQDTACTVVIHFDRRVDAQQQRHLADAAITARDGKQNILLWLQVA
jgi:hypothetical protein